VNNPDLRRVRGLAWAGVLGCVFFLVAAGLLQLTRSDLDPWQHTLSFYLHGPGSLWLCLAYLLLGVAMAAGGRLLCRLAPAPSPAGQAVMACLAVAGVGLVCVATGDRLFPPDQLSRPGLFHHFTAYCAFAAVLLALPVQALRFAAHPGWQRWAWTATARHLAVLEPGLAACRRCRLVATRRRAETADRASGQPAAGALLGLLHRLAAKRGNSRDNAGTTFSNDADHHHDRTL
jgi:hypothetical protein